jgi:putative glutamine amidotransferase
MGRTRYNRREPAQEARMARPRIGITRGLSPSKPVDEVPGSYLRYHERVREAGGEPVDLHPALDAPPDRLVADLDGVVICGGPDVNPSRFGEDAHAETYGIDDARDALELGVIGAALARDLPVLAICRGHQVLNVALGGPLLQHIDGDGHRAHDGGWGDSRYHDITIAPGSKLHALLGRDQMQTNSRHHQAITRDGLAPGLVPTAWSPDGLVEGLESTAHRWVVGVQWHPEREEVMDAFRPLFADFVAAAGVRVTVSAD